MGEPSELFVLVNIKKPPAFVRGLVLFRDACRVAQLVCNMAVDPTYVLPLGQVPELARDVADMTCVFLRRFTEVLGDRQTSGAPGGIGGEFVGYQRLCITDAGHRLEQRDRVLCPPRGVCRSRGS